jgi:hypothetical protein
MRWMSWWYYGVGKAGSQHSANVIVILALDVTAHFNLLSLTTRMTNWGSFEQRFFPDKPSTRPAPRRSIVVALRRRRNFWEDTTEFIQRGI